MKYATACPHTDRQHYAKGLCSPCYWSQKQKQRRVDGPATPRPPSRTPECHPERPHYAKGKCIQCYNAEHRRKYRADGRVKPEQTERDLARHRAYHRRHRYGLEPEEYAAMLERQGGKCAVCGRSGVRLVVEHDHSTNRIRGLVCDLCNHAISYLEGWIAQVGVGAFTRYLGA